MQPQGLDPGPGEATCVCVKFAKVRHFNHSWLGPLSPSTLTFPPIRFPCSGAVWDGHGHRGPCRGGNCVRDRFSVGLVGCHHGACSHFHGCKVTASHAGVEVPSRPAAAATCTFFLLSLQEGTGLEVIWECELVLWPQCGECVRSGGGRECETDEARNQSEESCSNPRSCELSASHPRCAFRRCRSSCTLSPDRHVVQRAGTDTWHSVSPLTGIVRNRMLESSERLCLEALTGSSSNTSECGVCVLSHNCIHLSYG